jgi:hypothetical protein
MFATFYTFTDTSLAWRGQQGNGADLGTRRSAAHEAWVRIQHAVVEPEHRLRVSVINGRDGKHWCKRRYRVQLETNYAIDAYLPGLTGRSDADCHTSA